MGEGSLVLLLDLGGVRLVYFELVGKHVRRLEILGEKSSVSFLF